MLAKTIFPCCTIIKIFNEHNVVGSSSKSEYQTAINGFGFDLFYIRG